MNLSSLLANLPYLSNLKPVEALWLIWLVVFFLFIILSIVFSYHWKHYGVQDKNLRFAEFIYYILSIIMLGFSALAITLFNTHL